jgi:hypothetical protein
LDLIFHLCPSVRRPAGATNARAPTDATTPNFYNERPRWLSDAYEALDRAVAAAYGWPEDVATQDALQRLLALNAERAKAQAA